MSIIGNGTLVEMNCPKGSASVRVSPMNLFQNKWTEKRLRQWEGQRVAGPVLWILQMGVMGWGTSMFLMMTAVDLWINGRESLSRDQLTGTMILWLVAGAIWGLSVWWVTERSYKKAIRSEAAE